MVDAGEGTEERIEEILDEGAAFVRGGDMTGAVARVRWAGEELSRRVADQHLEGPLVEELRGRVDHRVTAYELLLGEWQKENAQRRASYLKRERAAIGAAPVQ